MNNLLPKALLPLSIAASVAMTSGLATAAPGYKDGAALPTSYAQTIWAGNNGVIANDGLDDAAALQAIIDGISINNNPNNLIRIKLPAGEITLGDEIHVDRSGIVIEGAGTGANGTHVVVESWKPYTGAPGEAPEFDKKYWPGFGAFRAETRIKHEKDLSRTPNHEGSVNFHWYHSIEVGAPARLGDTTIELERYGASKFSVGDLVYVGAANDDAFLDLGQVPEDRRGGSHIDTGHMRTQMFHVTAVDTSAETITIDKPLEFNIELTNTDGYKSRVMPVKAVQNVGFRDFTLTMDKSTTDCANNNSDVVSSSNPNGAGHRYENLCPADAIHGLILKWADDAFVDNVDITMMGSHPIVTEFAKNVTFQQIDIDGSWNKGKGGNGYFRGSKLYDSVIKDNNIKNVRHLTLQWSATGNIVENNDMNVDMNLHGGWERNNIIRNNTIAVPFLHRSWDNGAPEGGTWQPIWFGSGDHASKWSGPTGPNNVFINNTLKKAKTEGASISRWGLFDTPDVAYAFAWDGEKYVHPTIDGVNIETWTQEIAEGVYAQMPTSGVTTNGDTEVEIPEVEYSIEVTAPVDGSSFELGQTITLAADAVSTEFDITKVNFRINGAYYAQDRTAPFNTTWTPTEAGTYTVDAVVTNADGVRLTAASRSVTIVAEEVEVPEIPETPVTGCSTTINVPWNARTEVTLSAGACLKFSKDLSDKTFQAWDSDANSSCDFRGTFKSVDGSGSYTVSSNYSAAKPFTGTTLQVQAGYSCNFVKVRAY